MFQRRFLIIICAISSVARAPFAYAGAWPMQEGKGQMMVKVYRYFADEAFDPNYDWIKHDIEGYYKTGAEIFVEYGVGNDFTIGSKQYFADAYSYGLLKRKKYEATAHEAQRYFIRKTVFDPASKKVIGAAELEIGLPGFYRDGEDERNFGRRSADWMLKALYGKTLTTRRLKPCGQCPAHRVKRFLNVEFGVGQRFLIDDMSLNSSEFRYRTEVTQGYEVDPYFLWSQTSYDFAANSKRKNDELNDDILEGNYDVAVQRFTLGRHIAKDVSLAVGAAFPFGGRDVIAGKEINLMLWKRF